MSDDFLDGLDQEFAESWKPDPGDTLQGIVVHISSREGKFSPYPVVTVRRINGPRGAEVLTNDRLAIHCQPIVLRSWVEETEMAKGDRVAVRYNGQRTNEKGTSYYDYAKVHQPAAEVPANLRPSATNTPTPAAEDFEPF